jgi:hypothetical protein
VYRAFGLRRESLDHLEKCLTGRGQLGSLRDPAEEGGSDLGLEVLDLLAKWGLPDADACGCAGEIPLLGDGEEVTDVS